MAEGKIMGTTVTADAAIVETPTRKANALLSERNVMDAEGSVISNIAAAAAAPTGATTTTTIIGATAADHPAPIHEMAETIAVGAAQAGKMTAAVKAAAEYNQSM